jgi:hypothetical protein
MPDRTVVVLSLSDCVELYDAHLLKIRGLSKSNRFFRPVTSLVATASDSDK